MKTSKNILSAAMALVLLTGCSSQPAAPAQTETDTVAASNVLRVGMECNYAPFNWTTTTQTDMTVQISGVDYADGYDVQIARKLADDLGMELQIVKLDWDSLILSLQKDQIDAVIAGMTATEERMKQVDFTTPYYVSEEVIIVRKDSDLANIKNVQELSGKKVQGQMNTIYDDIIDQIDGVQHMPAAETFPASIQALQAGVSQLSDGSDELTKGIGLFEEAITAAAEGSSQLSSAVSMISSAGCELGSAYWLLVEGMEEFADGLAEFDEEGIQSLAELAGPEYLDVIKGVRAARDAEHGYNNFSGICEGQKGSVKFIIETAEISAG